MKTKSYQHHQSPLYKIGSKPSLSRKLNTENSLLVKLAKNTCSHYKPWHTKQKERDKIIKEKFDDKKRREIQEPKGDLRELHNRIAALLSRIKKPDYVISATKGKSYETNAKHHLNRINEKSLKIDIKNFYQSIRQDMVERFFLEHMKCAPDIARLLGKLCCIKGKLPTGSPISPFMSYFACKPMFEEINLLASSSGLTFTLYIDDMFFSGANISWRTKLSVLQILSKYGFHGHKIACFDPNQPRVITGVALTKSGLKIPFSRIKRMRLYRDHFNKSDNKDHIETLGKTLLGQYREASRIEPLFLNRVQGVKDKLDASTLKQVALAERIEQSR